MRSERFTEPQEIKRILSIADKTNSGPILFNDNGTLYCDTSESHALISGKTRSGKSSTEVKSFVRSEVEAENCVVAIDPKGEIMRILPYAKGTHNIFILNFRHPSRSPDRFDPLESPTHLYKSGIIENKDIASSMISEFSSALFPCDANSDPFWPNASARLLEGCIYSLLELCDDQYCNLRSIVSMFEKLEVKIGGSFLLKEFANSLPDDSIARKAFATYITGEHATRASIHSVASAGIAPFSRSNGIMKMLSNGTLKIHELDVDKPFFIDIILPDETSGVYSSIAGLLVSELTQHLIRLAEDKYGGRLPRRTTIFIEELSSVASAISNLPHLMSTALGRNIRMALVLQDPYSQLQTAFGEAKAKAIQANVGVTVAFSTNDWNSLNALSNQVGEREIEWNGELIREPLITPHQLGSLSTGCCLVLLQNKYKWITKLPFYENAFNVKPEELANYVLEEKPITSETKIFDMEEFVKAWRQKEISSLMKKRENTSHKPTRSTIEDREMSNIINLIDQKISEIEEEEKRAKQGVQNKYAVRIENPGKNKAAIRALFAASQHIYTRAVLNDITEKTPILIFFESKDEADAACNFINELPGAKATCDNKQ